MNEARGGSKDENLDGAAGRIGDCKQRRSSGRLDYARRTAFDWKSALQCAFQAIREFDEEDDEKKEEGGVVEFARSLIAAR